MFFFAAGPNQDAGMKIVYRTLPVPYLKKKDISFILNRASLAPCFLAGQETPTVPASLARHFPLGKADTRDKLGFRGEHVGYDLCKTQRANALSARSGRATSCRKTSENGEDASKVGAWTSIKAVY